MFDVSFFELLVIGVVALLVIGPERLPGAIRTGALWFGRLKRTITETRTEIEKHIGADEIRRQLHNEQVMASLEKLKESRAALERDLLDYQAKLDAELRNAELIDQPAEITHSHQDHDHDHDHDHSVLDSSHQDQTIHQNSHAPKVNLHKPVEHEHLPPAEAVEDQATKPAPPATDSH